MQATVTSRDQIQITVDSNELALIDYALAYFASNANAKDFGQRDINRAQQMSHQLFNVYPVISDDEAQVA